MHKSDRDNGKSKLRILPARDIYLYQKSKIFLSIALVSTYMWFAGCTVTPYRPLGPHGGYSDIEVEQGQFRIYVRGQYASRYSTIKEYFYRRAKEVCGRFNEGEYKIVSLQEMPCLICLMEKPEVLGTVECLGAKNKEAGGIIVQRRKGVDSAVGVDKALDDLVQQMYVAAHNPVTKVLAILPITSSQNTPTTPLGGYLTDKLIQKFISVGRSRVIERTQLNRVIEELSLTRMGSFNELSAKSIGGLLGVDSLVIGSYVEVGDSKVELNLRFVNVETGEVLGAGSAQFPKSAVIQLLP